MEQRSIDTAARYAALAAAGELSDSDAEELLGVIQNSPDARLRRSALGAAARAGGAHDARAAWRAGMRDADPAVRRHAATLAPLALRSELDETEDAQQLLRMLDDDDALVAESAAWALGEIPWTSTASVAGALARTAGAHPDPLVREAAVAALGAIGDPAGLPAILRACTDRPQVRRRAVLALAPYDGPEVDAALRRALTDSDWQTRQAAEDLL
jgi:HEAT repeat protein